MGRNLQLCIESKPSIHWQPLFIVNSIHTFYQVNFHVLLFWTLHLVKVELTLGRANYKSCSAVAQTHKRKKEKAEE